MSAQAAMTKDSHFDGSGGQKSEIRELGDSSSSFFCSPPSFSKIIYMHTCMGMCVQCHGHVCAVSVGPLEPELQAIMSCLV